MLNLIYIFVFIFSIMLLVLSLAQIKREVSLVKVKRNPLKICYNMQYDYKTMYPSTRKFGEFIPNCPYEYKFEYTSKVGEQIKESYIVDNVRCVKIVYVTDIIQKGMFTAGYFLSFLMLFLLIPPTHPTYLIIYRIILGFLFLYGVSLKIMTYKCDDYCENAWAASVLCVLSFVLFTLSFML